MKIAFIINSLGGGGAERVVQTLSGSLVNKDYDVHVVLLNKGARAYRFDSRVNIHVLKTSFLSRGMGKIIFIPLQSIELLFLLNRLKISKAISFLVRSNLVFSFGKYFSKRKVIISERNYSKKQYEENTIKNNLMNFFIRKLYKKADVIIPISNGIKESLVEDYGLDPANINVIYNPQDISFIEDCYVSEIDFVFDSSQRYFITIGRLIGQKDHLTLIRAFKLCNEVNRNTRLIILGEGELRGELERSIKRLGLQDFVFLLGFVENTVDYLKRSDIFVFSSIFEGFGNVLIEAMACGLPVISTDCPSGPAEILDDGEYGILTEVGSAQGLSDAMISMLDEKNYLLYKARSLQRKNYFDVSIIEKEYLKCLYSN